MDIFKGMEISINSANIYRKRYGGESVHYTGISILAVSGNILSVLLSSKLKGVVILS